MIDRGKKSVLGIGIDAVDYDAAVDRVVAYAHQDRPMAATALAVHGVMTGVLDRAHNYRLNQFDLVVPDGQPVRWALNWRHRCSLAQRVYGPEWMLRLCRRLATESLPIFLFGSQQPTLDQLQTRLKEIAPGLQVAGTAPSAFRTIDETERDQLAARIRASGAKVCFVGLGCPRQEVFAYEMRERIGMPLIAVGAAFAFHSGTLSQAPPWMQARGLEWFYRLTREPMRLWKRYLFLNPMYLTLLAAQLTRLWPAATDRGEPPTNEVRFG
jgi:N-acetylglucosaminyldiphosphoundecaprenol N-acetyl-beta-D-mannosaminyltransferase